MSDLCYLCLGGPAAKHIAGYEIDVCRVCMKKAQMGWPTHFEDALKQALGRAGLLIPDRNEHGRYPLEYAPPANHAL